MRVKTSNIIVAALLALPSVALWGGTTANKNGYLQDYHRLGHVGGVPLEQVWIYPQLDIRAYRTLYIAPVEIDPEAYRRHPEIDRDAATRLAEAYRKVLERELKDTGIFEFVSTDPYFSLRRDGALSLETRLTEVNSGNPCARVWIGFGAGATEVQVEGKIVEIKTCRTLAEYADRRLHGGGAFFWGSQKAADGEFLIGFDMKQILKAVTKLFVYLREEGAPANQR